MKMSMCCPQTAAHRAAPAAQKESICKQEHHPFFTHVQPSLIFVMCNMRSLPASTAVAIESNVESQLMV